MDGVTSCKMEIQRKGEEVRGGMRERELCGSLTRSDKTSMESYPKEMLCCLSSSKHQACPSEKGRHTEIEI